MGTVWRIRWRIYPRICLRSHSLRMRLSLNSTVGSKRPTLSFLRLLFLADEPADDNLVLASEKVSGPFYIEKVSGRFYIGNPTYNKGS